MTNSPPPLVVGVGNRDRGDDAVGPLVADQFTGRDDVEVFVAEGDLSDLPLRWDRDQCVVIVDAMTSGGTPGSSRHIDALTQRLPLGGCLVSSHGVGLSEAIELARLLDRLPRHLTIIAVEGGGFVPFDDLSPAVADVMTSIGHQIERVLGLASRADVDDEPQGIVHELDGEPGVGTHADTP